MWLIAKNGFPEPIARPLAAEAPTRRADANPGPVVAAIASSALISSPDVSMARSMMSGAEIR